MQKYILIVLTLFSVQNIIHGSDTGKTDSVPTYSFEELEDRFGKKSAELISQNKVAVGFSRSMVILAKGKPYLVEEPLGRYMDFEILHCKDCTVFIEYGVVTAVRYRNNDDKG